MTEQPRAPVTPERSLALEMARDAGNLLLRYFRQASRVEEKGPLDLVTEADLASESLIRARITQTFPGDAVTAEESGRSGDSTRRWFIDPLDGTVNFAHGVASFAVCIAFEDAGGVQEAVVLNPATLECFTASRGCGAQLNGLPTRCSAAKSLSSAHTFVNPHGFRSGNSDDLVKVYQRLGPRVLGILNPGSMSMGLCAIAAGRLDAAVALDVDIYSTPASALILSESGALVTDLRGAPYTSDSGSIIAAAPGIHHDLLSLLGDLAPVE